MVSFQAGQRLLSSKVVRIFIQLHRHNSYGAHLPGLSVFTSEANTLYDPDNVLCAVQQLRHLYLRWGFQ